jgi:hypothetical protein
VAAFRATIGSGAEIVAAVLAEAELAAHHVTARAEDGAEVKDGEDGEEEREEPVRYVDAMSGEARLGFVVDPAFVAQVAKPDEHVALERFSLLRRWRYQVKDTEYVHGTKMTCVDFQLSGVAHDFVDVRIC